LPYLTVTGVRGDDANANTKADVDKEPFDNPLALRGKKD
jgi:hypothetical protein